MTDSLEAVVARLEVKLDAHGQELIDRTDRAAQRLEEHAAREELTLCRLDKALFGNGGSGIGLIRRVERMTTTQKVLLGFLGVVGIAAVGELFVLIRILLTKP